MRKNAILRIRIITGIVLFLSVVLIGRLYFVQIMEHKAYIAEAQAQYVHTVHDLYSRGTIYFTTKSGERVAAATIQSGYLLAIDPSRLDSATTTYAAVNAIIPINEQTFMNAASHTERQYAQIADQLTPAEADQITALNLNGVMLYRDQWRYYPGNELEARTIGFVGYTSDASQGLTGRYGLERYYDSVLTRNNKRQTVNFFAEIFSNLGSLKFDNTNAEQGNIVTTIEPTVARFFEDQLQQVQDKWHSKMTGGMIIDPNTGAIIAMDTVPTFDLNNRGTTSIAEFVNPNVEDVFEMGSIVKTLTMATGLASGAVTPATTYNDTGCVEANKARICNWDFRARGVIPMKQIIMQSLNVGAAWVEQQVGNDRFRKYFLSYGLGDRTGIDLPYEASGLVQNLYAKYNVDFITAAFGQGIAITPVEAIRAISAVANGGYLVTPHLVSEIDYENGTVKKFDYSKAKDPRVFSTTTSQEVSAMMTDLAEITLYNGKYKMPHYSFGVKTGTAQVVDPKTGKYYADRYFHSFVGFFPTTGHPRFLILLYTDQPQNVKYASQTLTVPFVNTMKFLINYYNLPPDR